MKITYRPADRVSVGLALAVLSLVCIVTLFSKVSNAPQAKDTPCSAAASPQNSFLRIHITLQI